MAAIPGPPRRKVDKSPERLTNEILACRAPTYYNAGKAWNILGYYRQERPGLEDFVEAVDALWDHQAKLTTLKGRRARAYMIDALRTLGFRGAQFHPDRYSLQLAVDDQDGSWSDLPDPPRGGYNYGKSDAREYLAAVAPRASPREPMRMDLHVQEVMLRDFHLFHGFSEIPWVGPKRALHVPSGADSLWYCLSHFLYRRDRLPDGSPVGGHSLWHHWEVKARIWTYFMQVLKDPSHERWAEYHLLQQKSKTVDPDFGTLSMARSLYASSSQGKPAYPHEYLLHVIADYFCAPVDVYTSTADDINKDSLDLSVTSKHYAMHNQFSDFRCIRLATNHDKTQYSIVVSDSAALDKAPDLTPDPPFVDPWEAVKLARERAAAARRPNPRAPDEPIPVPAPRKLRPPCEHARYNYFAPEDRPALEAVADAEGVIPPQTPVPQTAYYPAGDGAANHVVGVLPWRLPQERWGDVLLTPEVFARFRAGIDIPGWGFAAPEGEVVDRWLEEAGGDMFKLQAERTAMPGFVHTPERWQWRFGEDPMGLGQRPLPSETVEEGRHMLDDPYLEFERDRSRAVPGRFGR
ncbi:uncharacterized protein B0H64DRAFT_453228 [Chaetomium fimeti]|uniref:Uncharacterized protein n=1 Tax=Chaetomium fimeti TaxID=1854472 RepID=A0AAE0H5R8_9PEZI|nr:hypothetical protein B0H64DRAFT_453228 [Chaetomium fimeti]